MLQNSGKHQPDLLMDNGCDIVRRQVISGSKAFCPVCMGSGQWVGTQVAAAEERLTKSRQLGFETRRQNGQTHDLDQANVFLFDMVEFGVRMIQPERVFGSG